jgi:Spy/CpxP family protein refolding chaperone
MSKALTPEQKAAAKEKKALGGAAPDDLSEVKGTPHTVEFDHTYDDSEGIKAPDKEGKMQYTGHDKQIRTTVHSKREFPNLQLAEQFKENHAAHPEHGVTNVVIKKA